MKRLFLVRFHLLQRLAVALFLVGLFFSSGEGIRLLPFPETESTSHTSPFSKVEGLKDLHNQGVSNSGRTVKEQKPVFLLPNSGQRPGPDPATTLAAASSYLAPSHRVFSRISFSAVSDRAPPTV